MGNSLILNNVHYSPRELRAVCEDSIASDKTPLWEKKVYLFIFDWLSDNLSIVQESSGTTGQKKVFNLQKKSMIASAINACAFFDFKQGDSALLCLPVDYIAGKMMVVRAFVGNLNLLLTQPLQDVDLSNFKKIDFCAMVPYQVAALVNKSYVPLRIKKLIIGGAPLSLELEKAVRSAASEVFVTYGMAETCSQVAIRSVSRNEPYYTAMPGISFAIDERNCLIISAPYLDNKIVTNDVVELLDCKRFNWKRRIDNLINSGGVKINPEELENIISKKINRECAVASIPDEKYHEKVVLVLQKENNRIALESLKEIVREEIPKHLLPQKIVYVNSLPRTSSFKIDRVKLRLIAK